MCAVAREIPLVTAARSGGARTPAPAALGRGTITARLARMPNENQNDKNQNPNQNRPDQNRQGQNPDQNRQVSNPNRENQQNREGQRNDRSNQNSEDKKGGMGA